MEYDDFHIVAVEAVSDRIAGLLRQAGIAIQRRVVTEAGRPEYVISVRSEDFESAQQILQADLGTGRTFSSTGGT